MSKRTEPIPLDCSDPADACKTADLALARLRWRCRRGLLELDLLFAHVVAGVSADDRSTIADLERLLEHSDHDLQRWLRGEGAPAEPALQALITRLQAVPP
ncbi:MAG: FAD assembly factor SdhE [Acidiferrobacteraceae bacterium]